MHNDNDVADRALDVRSAELEACLIGQCSIEWRIGSPDGTKKTIRTGNPLDTNGIDHQHDTLRSFSKLEN